MATSTSIFLAQLIGLTIFIICTGIILNWKKYHQVFNQILKESSEFFINGIIYLVIGISMVLNHNIWESSWVIIITLFGWVAILKGIMLICFPKQAAQMMKWFIKRDSLLLWNSILGLILGLVLIYFGFYR